MNITQRQVILGLFAMQLLATLLILAGQIQVGGDPTVTLIVGATALVIAGLMLAYWRGWEAARYLDITIITLVIGLGVPEPYVTQVTTPVALIPPAIALILVGPTWIIGSMLAVIGLMTMRGGGTSAYISDLRTVGAIVILVGAMFLSRLVAESARRTAGRSADQATEALARSEQQGQRLAESADALAEQNARQGQLIELVATLETPVVTLAEGVLLAPLVGHLDSRRAAALTSRLLQVASERRARLVVLDITGVAAVDTSVAQALLRAARALRLLGCRVTITGISPAVATTLTALGTRMDGIATARTPQDALAEHAAE